MLYMMELLKLDLEGWMELLQTVHPYLDMESTVRMVILKGR